MTRVAELYERNAEFAESFDKGDLPIPPKLSMLILACVDARVGPEITAGIELGDAWIIRNVGGKVSDAVATQVAMLWMLAEMARGDTPNLELAIIQHTNCGMERFATPEVGQKVTERFGTPAVVETYAIADLDESVRSDVERLRSNPLVPRELTVSGHVYDVKTGLMREVVPAQTLG